MNISEQMLCTLIDMDVQEDAYGGFSLPDITVAAWKNDNRLSIFGYEHPDNKRAELTVRRLVELGLMEHCGIKLYRVTPAGHERAFREQKAMAL